MTDDDVSAHRTRSNRRLEPIAYDGHGAPLYPWQQSAPAPPTATVDAGYDAIEDRD